MKLIIIQSKYLKEGTEYIINAGGIIANQRIIKDSISYFEDNSICYSLIIHKNDFEFQEEDQKQEEKLKNEIKYVICK